MLSSRWLKEKIPKRSRRKKGRGLGEWNRRENKTEADKRGTGGRKRQLELLQGFNLLINIPIELTFAERRSPWSRQYAGNPILTTVPPLPDLASSMSLPVIIPSEIIFSPTRQHSLNKPSNSYTSHEQHSFSIDPQAAKT